MLFRSQITKLLNGNWLIRKAVLFVYCQNYWYRMLCIYRHSINIQLFTPVMFVLTFFSLSILLLQKLCVTELKIKCLKILFNSKTLSWLVAVTIYIIQWLKLFKFICEKNSLIESNKIIYLKRVRIQHYTF